MKFLTHISAVAYSGALILVPSLSLWQNSSLIWTPGYGDAPKGGSKRGGNVKCAERNESFP